jgi:hypothetical protein
VSLTAERLRDLVHYDPETGIFTHRVGRKGAGTYAGGIAGRLEPKHGYRRIGIDGHRFRANRLAWLYMTGVWPDRLIDHANGNPSDDRFSNLRLATSSQNGANCRKPTHNASGFKGVNWHAKAGKWRAYIKNKGKPVHIGYFASAEAAHAAYMEKARELFGEFARAA